MNNRVCCHECMAIARELGEAHSDAWTSSDKASRDAWLATYKLIGGTEEDVARAEELIPFARLQDPLRINRPLLKKFAHEARSGHKIVPTP